MTDDLRLFDPAEIDPHVVMVAVCVWCNEAVAVTPIEGPPGAPWGQAEKWSYLAIQTHLRECAACPEDKRPLPHHCDGCP